MSRVKLTTGSVCAAQGFRAAGVAAGIKPSGHLDVTLIASDRPAAVAAVFTTNRICAAPVQVSREHVRGGVARAIVVNAGNANACTGEQGLADAREMARFTAEVLSAEGDQIPPEQIVVCSTGIIGRPLPLEKVEAGVRDAAGVLSPTGSNRAARAIMTTDTRPKECAVHADLPSGQFSIGGICKGSGMIAPNMATMLAFLTTDAEIAPELLQTLLGRVADQTFNCVTVDGDTSTNDTLVVLANGASGVRILHGTDEFRAFKLGLNQVCRRLSRELARDGEGATKLVEVRIRGARTVSDARKAARSVANSPLVKTALFGNDPNWGRILCAVGYSGAQVDPNKVSLWVAGVQLVCDGTPVAFDVTAASAAMKVPKLLLEVNLGKGSRSASVWTCDLSYDYVRINAEYTT